MEAVMRLIGWQVSFGLNRCREKKNNPVLKLPSLDELKQMRKDAYRRFSESLKHLTRYN